MSFEKPTSTNSESSPEKINDDELREQDKKGKFLQAVSRIAEGRAGKVIRTIAAAGMISGTIPRTSESAEMPQAYEPEATAEVVEHANEAVQVNEQGAISPEVFHKMLFEEVDALNSKYLNSDYKTSEAKEIQSRLFPLALALLKIAQTPDDFALVNSALYTHEGSAKMLTERWSEAFREHPGQFNRYSDLFSLAQRYSKEFNNTDPYQIGGILVSKMAEIAADAGEMYQAGKFAELLRQDISSIILRKINSATTIEEIESIQKYIELGDPSGISEAITSKWQELTKTAPDEESYVSKDEIGQPLKAGEYLRKMHKEKYDR